MFIIEQMEDFLHHSKSPDSDLWFWVREVAKTIIHEQDPPNHKTDGDLCLHPPSSTSKDGVFIA